MSARYDEAVAALDTAGVQYLADDDAAAEHWRGIGQGRALLALAEEVEALVELLRDRLAPGPCGHVVGDQCRGCDHAAHHGSACLAAVVAASGGLETCRCRFDEETSAQSPDVVCGHRPGPAGPRCTLLEHPAAVLHADEHGNAWT